MFGRFADHRFYNQNTFNFWAHLAISAEIAHFGKDRNWHARLPIPGCGTTSSIMTISPSRGFGRLPAPRHVPRHGGRPARRTGQTAPGAVTGPRPPRCTEGPRRMHPAGQRYARVGCESPSCLRFTHDEDADFRPPFRPEAPHPAPGPQPGAPHGSRHCRVPARRDAPEAVRETFRGEATVAARRAGPPRALAVVTTREWRYSVSPTQ